jgi:hypothetical protein
MVTTRRVAPCPNCSSGNLFRSRKPVSAGGGYAPNYLPGLGGFFLSGRFHVVVCRDCGLTRFFAHRDATAKLGDSGRWERV